MLPLPATPKAISATNRLPSLSKARPWGRLNPEAKVLCAPFGVNFKIFPPPASLPDTNRFCADALEQIRMAAPKHITPLNRRRETLTVDLNFVSVAFVFMGSAFLFWPSLPPKPFGVISSLTLMYCARFGRLLRGKLGRLGTADVADGFWPASNAWAATTAR